MRHGLLYLSADTERLFRVDGTRLEPVDDDSGFEALTVVADFVEESLVRASLPKMFGRDMQALVGRRLEQEFRETRYRTSARLGTTRGNDKQADYLFTGLPIARRLDDRLRPMVERGVAIRGLFTVTMLAAHWARRGKAGDALRLVVLPTPAGVRFILLDRGQAVLSRLTALQGSEPGQVVGSLVEELERTVQYFYNARMVDRGQRIELWVWGKDAACVELVERELPGVLPGKGPGDARLGDPAQDGALALFRLAARQPPANQLAPDSIRRFYALAQLRRALIFGGAAIGLLLAAMAGHSWQQSLQLRSQDAALQQSLAAMEADNAELRQRAQAMDVDATTVAETIRSHDVYLDRLPSLRTILVAASRAFDQVPSYRLDSLRWDVIDSPRPDPSGAPQTEATPGACPMGWQPDPTTGERPQSPRAGLSLRGQVTGDATLREVLVTRQRFEAVLEATPGFTLQTAAAAVDASGSGVLRGGGEQGDARTFDYCLSTEAAP